MADIYLTEIAPGSDVVLIEPGAPKVSVVADFPQTFSIAPSKVAVVANFAQSFAIDGTATYDATKAPLARVVVFGGGIRTVVFAGGIRTVRF